MSENEKIFEPNLTLLETRRLIDLELVIERNLKAFYEVGAALMQIRDDQLYREKYETFEGYCQDKWQFSRSYAYRLIASSFRRRVPHVFSL
jgi:hypothetical protein